MSFQGRAGQGNTMLFENNNHAVVLFSRGAGVRPWYIRGRLGSAGIEPIRLAVRRAQATLRIGP